MRSKKRQREPSDGVGGPAIVWTMLLAGVVAFAADGVAQTQSGASPIAALKALSLEDLMNIEVTSVSKMPGTLSDAPAAIYVITRDDILRSGATTVTDMLRLAPNLQVAQITAGNFAVTARGFNGPTASKLLALIDGRSIYTPYHSGVSWDVQDVLPENIERIEVISGPGAALWGANAVNGVINIITRKSSETQGGSLEAGGGNLEQRAHLQYGGKVSDDISYRAYVDSSHHGNDVTATGSNARDGWKLSQGGFRFDWAPSRDQVTVQGDFYQGLQHQLTNQDKQVSGDNVLARWNHVLANGSTLQIQGYYDYTAFSIPAAASDFLNTYDFDIQHSFSWGSRQRIVWGGGYRVQRDYFPTILSSGQEALLSPARRTLNLGNVFVQDSIALTEALQLTLGTKFEDDTYTGFEPLPNVRLSWKITDSDLVWAAVSRAVRAPSRIDRDLFVVVGPVVILKGGNFESERLTAYEVGYRAHISRNASISMSTFHNVYDDLRSLELAPDGAIIFGNGMAGHTDGVEIWGNYAVNAWWRLAAGANWLHETLHFKAGSLGLGGAAFAGNDPSYQASVRSTMDFARDWSLNLDLRRIAALPAPASPAYTELDARIAWMASRALEFSITGSNFLHSRHLEFSNTAALLQLGESGVETDRSYFINARWRF